MYDIPRGVLRGGVGRFRGIFDASSLAAIAASSGTGDGIGQLTCTGDASPKPDWARVSANPLQTPAQCVSSTANSPFQLHAPSLQLRDASYDAADSWRANLSWTTGIRLVAVSASWTGSFSSRLPTARDLNFTATPRFLLTGEGGRPMFVENGIDPASGLVSSTESRRLTRFGEVVAWGSHGESMANQFLLTARPSTELTGENVAVALSYALTYVRERGDGFTGTTSGDPTTFEWHRSASAPRHHLVVQIGTTLGDVTVAVVAQFASGRPFTPLVGGDINGDGRLNDRVFIFDPSRTADTALARGLRDLSAAAPAYARDCILRQLGRIAAANSCDGPWTATMNLRAAWSTTWPNRQHPVSLSVNLANPLGGLDQLLHGGELRGWGSPAAPNPTLLFPRRFDPSHQQFDYVVNRQFGRTLNVATAFEPFRLSLEGMVPLGRPLPQQQIERWLAPGRTRSGRRLSASDLASRYSTSVPELYRAVLAETDSLLLTPDQVAALRPRQAPFRARLDSLWGATSTALVGLPNQFDSGVALRLLETAIDAAWEMSRVEARTVLPSILTPLQMSMLPWPVNVLSRATHPVHLRVFAPG